MDFLGQCMNVFTGYLISYFYFARLSVGFLMIRKLRLPGLINRDDIESLLAFLDD